MIYFWALAVAFLTGLFFLGGLFLNKLFKKNRNLIDFVLGMAISIMIGLIFCDLLPECFEMLENFSHLNRYLLIIGIIILGMLFIKLFDLLIPHHNHDEKNHDHEHIEHIGLLSSLPLMFHNILEGVIIYNTILIDIKVGLLFALSVGMHNIPLGMQIGASIKSTKKRIVLFSLLILSTPLGAGLMYLIFNNVNPTVFGILLALTIGMLSYIIVFELIGEVVYNSNKLYAILGLIFGIIFIGLHFVGHIH